MSETFTKSLNNLINLIYENLIYCYKHVIFLCCFGDFVYLTVYEFYISIEIMRCKIA